MNKDPKCDRDAMNIPRPDISIKALGSSIMNMCVFLFPKCMTIYFHLLLPRRHGALPVSSDSRVTSISGTVSTHFLDDHRSSGARI